MSNALIGFSGFVGSNLVQQTEFDDLYNSKNIEMIDGKTYDLLICAGAPAEKWKANQDPEQDLANLNYLMNCLDNVSAKQAILISTIDVYPNPYEVDEETAIDPAFANPYGKHRFFLERFFAERFETLIIRLPGLFGYGLKKNAVYDFLHNNRLEYICPQSTFQFYDLNNLWRDIQTCLQHRLNIVNFATEPTSISAVAQDVFGFQFSNSTDLKPASYDFRTRYASLFESSSEHYIYSKSQVLTAMKRFVTNYNRENR